MLIGACNPMLRCPNWGLQVLARFFALWFTSIQERKFTGVHNRKLGILTLCTLLELDFARLPPYIQQVGLFIVRGIFTYTAHVRWEPRKDPLGGA